VWSGPFLVKAEFAWIAIEEPHADPRLQTCGAGRLTADGAVRPRISRQGGGRNYQPP